MTQQLVQGGYTRPIYHDSMPLNLPWRFFDLLIISKMAAFLIDVLTRNLELNAKEEWGNSNVPRTLIDQ